MKFCERPFNSIHLDPHGDVRVCSWTDACIGNLNEHELSEIWNGERAARVRESVLDGSFRYCRTADCPVCGNDRLLDLEEAEFRRRAIHTPLPQKVNIACDYICNHSCPSCRSEVFGTDPAYLSRLGEELRRVTDCVNQAVEIGASGNGDLFASEPMLSFLETIRPVNPQCRITLETNGALLDREHWARIAHLGRYRLHVIVTVNSFEPHTFRYLNGGHDTYRRVMDNLAWIRELRSQGDITSFAISIVIQDRNFWELPVFARRSLEEFRADHIIVKPLYRWFGLDEELYWHKNVLNPAHPYHAEYLEMMRDPFLRDKRIYYWDGRKGTQAASAHPAYVYRTYLQMARWLLSEGRSKDRLTESLRRHGRGGVYLYGDTELTDIVLVVFERCGIQVRGIVARDILRPVIAGYRVMPIHEFRGDEADVVIVLNTPYYRSIARDFHFYGIQSPLLSIREWLEEMGYPREEEECPT